MSRPASIHQPVLASLTLTCIAAAWWGCAQPTEEQTTSTTSTTSTSSTTSTGQGGSTGSSGTGGTGGIDVSSGSSSGSTGGASACISTSVAAEHIQLDIIFLIDQSGSMSGAKWTGTTKALTTFFNDPASAHIGAGLSYFPNHKPSPCVPEDYQVLDVPINVLPNNIFPLTNSMPADATGSSTPTYGAVKGALMAATAYQDAHPTHKVTLVLATDGEPNSCGATTIDSIAALAKGARDYNGVLTYVIGVEGSNIANLNKIAAGGGTASAYDITTDISQFTTKMNEIRNSALGCEFGIPPPPNGQQLDPDEVNFSYTPKGVGMSKILLRADDLIDCNSKPGWYYDSNVVPKKVILCPASCTTVQADLDAKISVLFGCKSQVN